MTRHAHMVGTANVCHRQRGHFSIVMAGRTLLMLLNTVSNQIREYIMWLVAHETGSGFAAFVALG